MSKEKLTFICPVYNEQEVIKEFYSELEIEVKSLHSLYDVKILFVLVIQDSPASTGEV